MTRLLLALAMLCCLGGTAFADIGKEELKKLARAGISDDVILSYVKSKGPVTRLSADDIIDLKAAGLSDGLLTTLVSMAEPGPATSLHHPSRGSSQQTRRCAEIPPSAQITGPLAGPAILHAI